MGIHITKVCILDYGSGNVMSVYNLVTFLGYEVIISNKISDIKSATHIILPGVGSFGAAMKKIKLNIDLTELEHQIVNLKKPFLGICVGMQVLATKGYEHGEMNGLGWVPGNVKLLKVNNLPLPHIGWNDLNIINNNNLLNGLDTIRDFYFLHSYSLETSDKYITSSVEYEKTFCASIQKNNIFGVQFHQEKSQKAGQRVLINFFNYK